MNYIDFVKNLRIFDVLFGNKAKKLTGLSDALFFVSADMTVSLPNSIQIPTVNPLPLWLKPGVQFRFTIGGGANNQVLFTVSLVDRVTSTITVLEPVSAYSGAARIDGRQFIIINDPLIATETTAGNTMYNVNREGVDCISSAVTQHYHDPIDPGIVFIPFGISDWFVTDAGDTWSIDVTHNLNTSFPDLTVFEDGSDDEFVLLHRWKVMGPNILRISVSNHGADARFNGTVRVEK